MDVVTPSFDGDLRNGMFRSSCRWKVAGRGGGTQKSGLRTATEHFGHL